jgi:branched-chain amino acid transport system ATP-binding protein
MNVLELRGVSAFYGGVQALREVDIHLGENEVVGILGPNGAGKTTTLRALSRLVRTTGEVTVLGRSVGRLAPEAVARLGVAHVPAGRGTFTDLTVDDNILVASQLRPAAMRSQTNADVDTVFGYFPILAEFRHRRAGSLSGGQQQMLAIARGLLTRPRVLMVDEPTLGLAPQLAREILSRLHALRDEWNLSILLVEQNAALALGVTDRVYVLESGQVKLSSSSADLTLADLASSSYLETS